MAELINLRQIRKSKAKEIKARKAEANRAKFGQSKAAKSRSKLLLSREKSQLDGHKLSNPAAYKTIEIPDENS